MIRGAEAQRSASLCGVTGGTLQSLWTTTTDLLKSGLGFVNKASSESAKTDLNKCPVEQDLAVNIECVDGLLQMGHQHHITGLVVIVV